jgi:cytochrome P450
MRSPAPSLAPEAHGHFLLGSLPGFRRDMMRTMIDAWREQGDVVRLRLAQYRAHLISHPEHIKYVLQDNYLNYTKLQRVDDKFTQVAGNGLVSSRGDFWLRQRRMTQPIFHRQRISSFAKVMTDTTAGMLQRWEGPARDGQALDMRVEMVRLSLAVLSQALFSADWGGVADDVGAAVTVAFDYVQRRMNALVDVPEWVPIPSNRRFIRARATVDEIVYRFIAERRAGGPGGEDLVSLLLSVRDDETGAGMTDQQLHDEITTMIFAGHETVSTALTWVWYLLSKHPAAARRVREEVQDALAGRVPTVDDLPKLPFTQMVVDESMRLYPPIWMLSRVPIKDDEIGGFRIPAGDMVFICPYMAHRHPDFWVNPEGFDPERFSAERAQGRHRYAFFPFGGGPRICIGDAFALLEMRLVVAMVAQRYRLDLVPGHPVVPQATISLRAKHGVLMRVRPWDQGTKGDPEPTSF